METETVNPRHAAARQRGVVAVLVAIILVVLVGFAALAVDLARVWVVRNELQNAADAAALAGAGSLTATGSSYVKPNWAQAQTDAGAAIKLNSVEGAALATAQVSTGYWNLTGSPSGLQSTSITPGANDRPAVMVTVSRSAGANGGPLQLWLAPVIGISTASLSASAVAVISLPGYAGPGVLFPVALAGCLYQNYWDAKNGVPLVDPKTNLPYEFTIVSAYHAPCTNAGQWTSFGQDANDVPFVRGLIANGNPAAMDVGAHTWIQPGTKTTLFGSVPVPDDVLLPVVGTVDTHSSVPIIAFAPFHIDSSQGGSCKCITGHFISNYKVSSSGGSGTYYGAYTPPVLVH